MKKLFILILVGQFGVVLAQKSTLTLEAAFDTKKSLYPEQLYGLAWIPGTDAVSYLGARNASILKKEINGKIDTVLKISDLQIENKAFPVYSLNGYQWVDAQTISIKGKNSVYFYSLTSKSATVKYSTAERTYNNDVHASTGILAYTEGNNLYLAKGQTITAVTQHDDENIVAGQAIARSEFGIKKGTFWSPSASFLAFYQKDETTVANYPLLNIDDTPGSLRSIKYPMAGQGSEIASVGVYNLQSRQTVYLKSTKATNDYMTNVGWDPSENYIYVAEVNRAQNHMKLNKYNAHTGDFVATLFEEFNDKWVEPETPPFFLPSKPDQFIWLSERDGFMNLYLYNTNGKLIRQLTNNKWVTKEIIAIDAQSKFAYIAATGQNATETHLYKVNLSNGKLSLLTLGAGTHRCLISESGNYFTDQMSSIIVPNNVSIRSAKDGYQKLQLLSAENPMADFEVAKPKIFTIKSADGQTDLYARMIVPSNFDASKKYPVLVYVYGGPHAQMVTNSYLAGAPSWMYAQAEKGYLIFTVDGRGSAHRGFAFESIIHRNLGDAELEDQLAGVAYLKTLPYVNPDQLAVHGWSYGGFMTASLMLRHPGVFKVGVAGGPVTDWKYYEAMYGERYMDTPQENPEGYKKAALNQYAGNLQGKLLLIHGTIDDVVVMQHNLSLVQAFVNQGVQMDFFAYPMHAHNIYGKDRLHLMTKVLSYIEEALEK